MIAAHATGWIGGALGTPAALECPLVAGHAAWAAAAGRAMRRGSPPLLA